jgi:hypothetical protein
MAIMVTNMVNMGIIKDNHGSQGNNGNQGNYDRDPRSPDFGGTVPILRAMFRVPPRYMAGHTFVPLFETFGTH